ncbi:MAG TPA: hypothetical protein VGV38_13150, partial [Pyrinomonadaceae bacterium]|nr:hypothetical protein [Pyrinomonadaceae bacterium]
MSYFGGTWRGDDDITRDERALELFTDRDKAVRLFSEYLNDDPPRRRVLYFYGDGGNGKSLLLKFLLRNYCRRLARGNWEFVRGTAEEDFARHLRDAQGARPVPYALLDFGLPAAGDEQPLQAFSGLLRLRRTLAESAREANYALRFPLYDFACLSYLRKTGGLTAERYRRLFPDEESEFVGEMVNAISNTSWGTIGKAVLGVFGKHAGEWYALYKHRRRLDEEQVERIHRLDPDAGLLDRLPFFFAEDLGVVLGAADAPERVLLAFDRHEAFWGFQRNLSDKPFFDKDKWLRQLLGAILDLPEGDGAGVVALVAGREAPRWSEAGEFNIPREFVETFLVGHLPEAHAAQYLERAGVSGEEMRRSLVAHARVAPGEVHPLRLGMCADVFLAAERKGEP